MKVRYEINRFADDSHKDALNWLFSRYFMQSKWSFVAKCTFKSYGKFSYQANRIWTPTEEGWVLYKNREMLGNPGYSTTQIKKQINSLT